MAKKENLGLTLDDVEKYNQQVNQAPAKITLDDVEKYNSKQLSDETGPNIFEEIDSAQRSVLKGDDAINLINQAYINDDEKNYLKQIRQTQSPDKFLDALKTLNGKQEGQFSYSYYFGKDGLPVPLKFGERPPVDAKVESSFGNGLSADDDNPFTTLAKSTYNAFIDVLKIPGNIYDVLQGVVTGEDSELANTVDNTIDRLKFETSSKSKEDIVNTKAFDSISEFVNSDNWNFTPDNYMALLGQTTGSLLQFLVPAKVLKLGAESGQLAKGASYAEKLKAVAPMWGLSTTISLNESLESAKQHGITGRDAYTTALITAMGMGTLELMGGPEMRLAVGMEAKAAKKLVADRVMAKFAKQGIDVSGEGLEKLYKQTLKEGIREIPRFLKEGASEASEEISQTFWTSAVEELHDKFSDQDYGTKTFSSETYKDAFLGALGGAFGGMLGGAVGSKEDQSKTIYGYLKEGKALDLKNELSNLQKSGGISPQDFDAANFKIDSYQRYQKETKDLQLNDDQKEQVFNLTYQDENIRSKIEDLTADNSKTPTLKEAELKALQQQSSGYVNKIKDILSKPAKFEEKKTESSVVPQEYKSVESDELNIDGTTKNTFSRPKSTFKGRSQPKQTAVEPVSENVKTILRPEEKGGEIIYATPGSGKSELVKKFKNDLVDGDDLIIDELKKLKAEESASVTAEEANATNEAIANVTHENLAEVLRTGWRKIGGQKMEAMYDKVYSNAEQKKEEGKKVLFGSRRFIPKVDRVFTHRDEARLEKKLGEDYQKRVAEENKLLGQVKEGTPITDIGSDYLESHLTQLEEIKSSSVQEPSQPTGKEAVQVKSKIDQDVKEQKSSSEASEKSGQAISKEKEVVEKGEEKSSPTTEKEVKAPEFMEVSDEATRKEAELLGLVDNGKNEDGTHTYVKPSILESSKAKETEPITQKKRKITEEIKEQSKVDNAIDSLEKIKRKIQGNTSGSIVPIQSVAILALDTAIVTLKVGKKISEALEAAWQRIRKSNLSIREKLDLKKQIESDLKEALKDEYDFEGDVIVAKSATNNTAESFQAVTGDGEAKQEALKRKIRSVYEDIPEFKNNEATEAMLIKWAQEPNFTKDFDKYLNEKLTNGNKREQALAERLANFSDSDLTSVAMYFKSLAPTLAFKLSIHEPKGQDPSKPKNTVYSLKESNRDIEQALTDIVIERLESISEQEYQKYYNAYLDIEYQSPQKGQSLVDWRKEKIDRALKYLEFITGLPQSLFLDVVEAIKPENIYNIYINNNARWNTFSPIFVNLIGGREKSTIDVSTKEKFLQRLTESEKQGKGGIINSIKRHGNKNNIPNIVRPSYKNVTLNRKTSNNLKTSLHIMAENIGSKEIQESPYYKNNSWVQGRDKVEISEMDGIENFVTSNNIEAGNMSSEDILKSAVMTFLEGGKEYYQVAGEFGGKDKLVFIKANKYQADQIEKKYKERLLSTGKSVSEANEIIKNIKYDAKEVILPMLKEGYLKNKAGEQSSELAQWFALNYALNFNEINDYFNGNDNKSQYKNITEIFKRNGSTLSPGVQLIQGVEGGVGETHSMVVINPETFDSELGIKEQHNEGDGGSYILREESDRIEKSSGGLYKFGNIVKAITNFVKPDGVRFLDKTNSVVIDDLAERFPDSKYAKIHKFMVDNKIMKVSTTDGTKKLGGVKPYDLFAGEKFNSEIHRIDIPYKHFLIQQDFVNSGEMNEGDAPIQQYKNEFISSFSDSIAQKYNDIGDKKLDELTAELSKSVEGLRAYILQELKVPQGEIDEIVSDIAEGVEANQEDEEEINRLIKNGVSFHDPALNKWLGKFISNIIKNRALGKIVNKGIYAEVGNLGLDLKNIREVDGKVLLPEVAVSELSGLRGPESFKTREAAISAVKNNPSKYADLYDVKGNIREWEIEGNTIPGEYVKIARIPADDVHSHTLARIKYLLPKESKNILITGGQQQVLAGSDFDGDQRHVQGYFKDKAGNINFGNGKRGLANQIFRESVEMYYNPEMQKVIKDYINTKRFDSYVNVLKDTTNFEKDSFKTFVDSRLKNGVGMKVVGASANMQAVYDFLKKHNSFLKNPFTFPKLTSKISGNQRTLKFHSNEKFKQFSKDLQIKSKLGTVINLALDNVKDPKIETLGINEVTVNMAATMFSLGIDEASIFTFLNHSVVKQFVKEMRKTGSSESETDKYQIFNKLYEDYTGGQTKFDKPFGTKEDPLEDVQLQASDLGKKNSENVLKKLYQLDKISSDMMSIQNVVKSTESAPASFMDQYVGDTHYQNVSNNRLENIDTSEFKNSDYTYMAGRSLATYGNLLGEYSVHTTNMGSDMLDYAQELIGKRLNQKNGRIISSAIESLFYNQSTGYTGSYEQLNSEVKALVNKNKSNSNSETKALWDVIEVAKNTKGIEVMQLRHDLKDKTLSKTKVKEVQDAIKKLKINNPEQLKMLIDYNIYQYKMATSTMGGSYRTLFPDSIIKEISKQIEDHRKNWMDNSDPVFVKNTIDYIFEKNPNLTDRKVKPVKGRIIYDPKEVSQQSTKQQQKESSFSGDKRISTIINKLKKALPSLSVVIDNTIFGAGELSADGKTVSLNPKYYGIDTPIHEYAHALIDIMGGLSNSLIARGVSQLKDTSLWIETKIKYPNLSEDMLAKEVLAEAIGREGANIFKKESKQSKFKTWIDSFFFKLKSLLGIKPNIAKQLAKQLLSGKEISKETKATGSIQKQEESSENEDQEEYDENKEKEKEDIRAQSKIPNVKQFATTLGISIDALNAAKKKLQKEAIGVKGYALTKIKKKIDRIDGTIKEVEERYEKYLIDFDAISKLIEENPLDGKSLEELLNLYGTIKSYNDVAAKDFITEIYNNIAEELHDRGRKYLQEKHPNLDIENLSDEDLKSSDIYLKAITDMTESVPEMQELARRYREASVKQTKQFNFIHEQGDKLAKEVIKEYYKDKPFYKRITENINIFGADNQNIFSFLETKQGDFAGSETKEYKAMTTAQKAMVDFMEEWRGRKEFVALQSNTPQGYKRNLLFKIDKSFGENFNQKNGLFLAYAHYLGNTFDTNDVKIIFKNPITGKTSHVSYGETRQTLAFYAEKGVLQKIKALALITKYSNTAKKNKRKGHHEPYQGKTLKLNVIPNGQYIRDEENKMMTKFGRKRSSDRQYSKDHYRAFLDFAKEMSFQEHMEPIVPMFEALEQFYAEGTEHEKKYMAEYLKLYKEGYLFQEEKVSKLGHNFDSTVKVIRKLTHLRVMAFNFVSAPWNVFTGKFNQFKQEKTSDFLKGEKRYWGGIKNGIVPGKQNKAFNIIERFGAVSVEKPLDPNKWIGRYFDMLAYGLTRAGEHYIQGAAFIGQFSDEMWDWFDNEGNIQGATEEERKQRIKKVNELVPVFRSKTENIQGKYSADNQRMYQLYEIGRALGQFKVWLPDAVKTRFDGSYIDIYGQKRQGTLTSLMTVGLNDIRHMMTKKEFWTSEELKYVNMRRNLKSLAIITPILAIALANSDDDDDDAKAISEVMWKAYGNFTGVFSMDQNKFLVKQPIAATSFAYDLLDAVQAGYEFKTNKDGNYVALNKGLGILPYNKLYKQPAKFLADNE